MMTVRLKNHLRTEEIRKVAKVEPITTYLMQKRLRSGMDMFDVVMIAIRQEHCWALR